MLCLDFSPDSKRAVTASKDGTWCIWNIDVRYKMDEDPKRLLQSPQPVRLTHCRLLAAQQHEKKNLIFH